MSQTYQHNPRPFGGPISFAIEGDRLIVDSGRKVREVRLGAVETVRMTYEPGRMGRKAYRTKVVMSDGKAFSFSSISWKSLVEAEQLTQEYRTFTHDLFAAVRQANPKARFIAGKPWWLWLATTILGVLCLLGMAFLIWNAIERGFTDVALLGGLFAGIGIWQIEPMVRLNKPRPFSPEAPPPELLPA